MVLSFPLQGWRLETPLLTLSLFPHASQESLKAIDCCCCSLQLLSTTVYFNIICMCVVFFVFGHFSGIWEGWRDKHTGLVSCLEREVLLFCYSYEGIFYVYRILTSFLCCRHFFLAFHALTLFTQCKAYLYQSCFFLMSGSLENSTSLTKLNIINYTLIFNLCFSYSTF